MKKQSIIVISCLFSIAFSSYAIDKYVTDDVNVPLRRGPGAQYAFSGTVKAGSKVNILETSQDGKYARIEYSDGRATWIETTQLSDEPSIKERLPALEAELADYKDKVTNADSYQQNLVKGYVDKLQLAEQTIATLQKQNDDFKKQVKSQSEQIDSMTTQVDDKRQSLITKWFIYGGLVAGGGLILGLILPVMIPGRRRKDRWMR